jgi:hypothetical protein
VVIARLKYRTTPPAARTLDETPSTADVSSRTLTDDAARRDRRRSASKFRTRNFARACSISISRILHAPIAGS